MIIYGGSLEHPIVLRDWHQHQRFLQNTISPNFSFKPPLDWRELKLALYWGVEWRERAADAESVDYLLSLARAADSSSHTSPLPRPGMSGIQVGRLYIDPARTHVVMALRGYDWDGWIGGEVGPEGKELLGRNGAARRAARTSHRHQIVDDRDV
jgi:hypothetical protein